jgi:hypothetical protein
VAAFQAEINKTRAYRKYDSRNDVYFIDANVGCRWGNRLSEKEDI